MKAIEWNDGLTLYSDNSEHNYYVVYDGKTEIDHFWAIDDTDAERIFMEGEY